MRIYICFILLIFSTSIISQMEIWGMTSAGGQFGIGTIFKTDGSGNNHSIEHSFFQIEGLAPGYTHLIQASDGMFYGMVCGGGVYNMGILFQYDPVNDIYTKKVDFNGPSIGKLPYGSLMQATDGKLYGVTAQGGVNDMGVLFQYDPITNICVKKIDFSGTANGNHPYGSLSQATDGMLYGMTVDGGLNNLGTLFHYNPATSVLTKKWDFDGTISGSKPFGSVLQASDGKLYGMTAYGGVNDYGVLFQYDIGTGIPIKKLDFSGYANGSYPENDLIQAADGMLYGMTKRGGLNNMGVIFQYNPITNGCIKKLEFAGITTGSYPRGSLVQASDSSIYGLTYGGGISDLGVLFQYIPSTNSFIKKIDFLGATNGGNPQGTLMQALDGNIYGMTNTGGFDNAGVLFKFEPTPNIYSKKRDFLRSIEGRKTHGSLIQASNGILYGMNNTGGSNNFGVIFQYDRTTNTYTKKIDFIGVGNGRYPEGSLMQASNGILYGMTTFGGTNDVGVLFKYDVITNTCTKTYDFTLATSGGYPYGDLMQASDGMLYGMASSGGTGNGGVLFQYNPVTDTYIKKIDFSGTANGGAPSGSLMQASDGMLYGVTFNGGTSTNGVLFQYNISTSTLTKKIDFVSANGLNPPGSLIQASNGMLYGLCSYGGTYGKGALFEYDLNTNNYTKKFDFDGSQKGMSADGSLLQASDGNLYGMTLLGGSNNLGVLFQYVPSTNTYNKKLDFNTINGSYPYHTNLIEIAPVTTALKDKVNINTNCITYPNPFNETFTIELKEKSQIIITNILAEKILEDRFNIGKHSINLKDQLAGIYFIKVENKKGQQMIKVLKE